MHVYMNLEIFGIYIFLFSEQFVVFLIIFYYNKFSENFQRYMDRVFENYQRIKTQVAHYNPTIVAVTKYFDESQIIKYYDLGIRDFGENRVKTALEKISKLPEEIKKTSRFHLIGHLQTNKAKLAVGNFYLIHSVDSTKLAKIISDEAEKKGIVQKIFEGNQRRRCYEYGSLRCR